MSKLLIACTVLMMALELPHQRLPTFPSARYGELYIIGDSISAGIDQAPNWGEIFQQRYGTAINNLAKPAATFKGAVAQSDLVSKEDCLLLLEIGGNDLLARAGAKQFEADLKALLDSLRKPGRAILMFELPLLPGQAALGRAQRRLANEYGVYLIPKRYFCRVFSTPGATTDGLHLSPIGTSLMADTVYGVIRPLLAQPRSASL